MPRAKEPTRSERRDKLAADNFKAFFEDDEAYLAFALAHPIKVVNGTAFTEMFDAGEFLDFGFNRHVSYDNRPSTVSFNGSAEWRDTKGKVIGKFQAAFYRPSMYGAVPEVALSRAEVQRIVYLKLT